MRAQSCAIAMCQTDFAKELDLCTSVAPVYTKRCKMCPCYRGQAIVSTMELEDIVEDACEDHEFREMDLIKDLEYDDEGNGITTCDFSLSSSKESFGIDDLE
ncbi:hypothetical protein KP509_21G025800 [Ceratopteris richardii]|uniref:Uncharacterized protein n=1 Tax=Ceratopteris richardii TaxID=49495 RepID=A0A8T2S8A3_CERRI|nr:hypothetical protein KP509_21G025800 [Ceratopteris richardii]